MGKIKQGILGGFSGSVGNIVGSSWKGIAVIKAKPLSVANPKTVAQTGNRTRFKSVTALASKGLSAVVKPLWDRDAQQMSGYNAFVQANKEAFTSAGLLVPENVVISKGKEAKQVFSVDAIMPNQNDITLNWDASALEGEQLETDEVFVYIHSADEKHDMFVSKDDNRLVETVTYTLPQKFTTGKKVYAYLAFRSVDGFRLFEQYMVEVTVSM